MIVVTGAGGAAGIAVIRALKARGEHVVAVDVDPLAAGLALADERALVALAHDDAFVADLCEVAKRFSADVVLCTVSEEMLALAGRESELADAGASIWLPARAAVEVCVDKLLFAQALDAAGIATPYTATAADAGSVPGPWIVKPRYGRGSRDVFALDDPDELAWIIRRVPDAIVQHRARGNEFTVDALVARDGTVAGAIPRWRLETKAGISTKGRTFESVAVVDAVVQVVDALQLRAAVNVQGFVADDGSVEIIEVNPRVSGGLSLTQAAGADVVGEWVRGTRGESVRAEHLRFRPGVTMRRYYCEVYS